MIESSFPFLGQVISWIFKEISEAFTECVSDPTLIYVTPVEAMRPTCEASNLFGWVLTKYAGF